MAGAGGKRARQLFSIRDVATVARWGDDMLEWVWGMREDSSVATKKACVWPDLSGRVKDYVTHKGDFNATAASRSLLLCVWPDAGKSINATAA